MPGRGGAKPSYQPPEALDEYRIVRPLGQGAMGYVYLAQDTLLDRPVAVKLIAQRCPDEASRRRFLAEARALARLSHPNVIAVHRAGEVDGHPYLVTELVRGKTLSELAKPLPPEQVITIGLDLARGLAAAHRKGVLHRDLKPANAILADDGDAKLIDFGLAVVADVAPRAPGERPPQRDSGPDLAGTPLYMAPETLRGEPATARSDIYALGAVLYELGTGVAHRETLSPDVDEEAWTLGVLAPGRHCALALDARLAAVVARCIEPSPEARYSTAEALADALAAQLVGPAPPPAPAGNPYRGLSPFEAEHRALFFGRSAEARAVVDRLREHALAVITGDSGVGKSSLCRASVLPLVENAALLDDRRYRPIMLLPGKRPYTALVTALAAAFSLDEAAIRAEASTDPDSLGRALRRALGREHGALLFIDQAEELTTIADATEARWFAEAVARLPSGPAGVRVLIAVRGDFFTRLAALPGLGEELARALYLLRPLSPEGVHAAIIGPAAQQGIEFDPPSLVTTLASAALDTSGGLPLLQFALAELWESRKGAKTITPALLDALGGVEGALARHADHVLGALPPDARGATKRLLLTLVTSDNTRARKTTSELDAGSPTLRAALEALVKGRLLVASEAEGETAYELAHEALIQGWGTLRHWLGEGGEARVRRDRVESRAAEWEREQRAPELLLRGKSLSEAESVGDEDLSPRARAMVHVSRIEVRRERWRRWGLIAAGPMAMVTALGGLRWAQARDLERLIAGHVATGESERASGQAKKRDAEDKRSRAYALFDAAHGDSAEEVTHKRDAAEEIWAGALEASREAEAKLVRAGQSLESALALDPTRSAIRGAIGDVTIERLSLAEAFHVEDRRADLELRLASYDPGGRRSAAIHAAPRVSLTTTPPGATATLERYEDREARKVLVSLGELGQTPLQDVALSGGPGSYRLTLRARGRVEVKYPVLLRAGERFAAEIALPAESEGAAGYIHVPAGRFLLGSAEPDALRKGFMVCPPLHEAWTGAFWIARDEVTFGEWLTYLDALPTEDRARRYPSFKARMWGVEITPAARGGWQIGLTLNGAGYTARQGEPIRLPARKRRSLLRWERLPVTGISLEDAESYFAWLSATGRVPGARSCDEREWERAARGADARVFPHGDALGEDEADFDLTYGRNPLAYGPDEVGSHPASESPFGLMDTTGNVYEVTRSMGLEREAVMRGGTWYYDSMSAMIPNRTMGERQTRDHMMGVRGCADAAHPGP